MERADEKRPTRWWAGWVRRHAERVRMRRLAERGEWGYVPPGCVVMSRRSYRMIGVGMCVVLLTNMVILAGQWPTVWRPYLAIQSKTTGTAATTPPTAATSATQ